MTCSCLSICAKITALRFSFQGRIDLSRSRAVCVVHGRSPRVGNILSPTLVDSTATTSYRCQMFGWISCAFFLFPCPFLACSTQLVVVLLCSGARELTHAFCSRIRVDMVTAVAMVCGKLPLSLDVVISRTSRVEQFRLICTAAVTRTQTKLRLRLVRRALPCRTHQTAASRRMGQRRWSIQTTWSPLAPFTASARTWSMAAIVTSHVWTCIRMACTRQLGNLALRPRSLCSTFTAWTSSEC